MTKPMTSDMHGRTRVEWGMQWLVWWIAVLFGVFLFYQLSRPLWDAKKLIQEKKQTCENNGMVMVQEKVKFGDVYSCKGANQ